MLQLRSQDAVVTRQLHKKLHERVTLLEAEIAASHHQLQILESQIEQVTCSTILTMKPKKLTLFIQEKEQNKALKDDLEKEQKDREVSLYLKLFVGFLINEMSIQFSLSSLKEVQGLLERATKRATDQEELISELRAANEKLQSRYFEVKQKHQIYHLEYGMTDYH